ncbi:hypothetical protein, partial [Acidovorax sp. PRC11]|uniref:hypothetical protein n=1 Tax=Acidovorax sp. PRC11 TaxID=2962592 RepID=UPI00288234CB
RFTVIEEGTGAGGYTIEGGSNGGYREHLTSEPGVRLLNVYGVGSPPSTYEAPLLANIYEITVLAIYSAVNTVAEVIDCYKSQIVEAFLFILLVLAVAILVTALTAGFGLGPAVVAVTATMATTIANASSKKGPGCELPKMRLASGKSKRIWGNHLSDVGVSDGRPSWSWCDYTAGKGRNDVFF